MTDAEFDSIASGFYRAAAGMTPWVDALLPLQRTMSAFAIYLHGIDLVEGSIAFSHNASEMAPEAEIDYIRRYHQIDPRTALALGEPVGQWVNCWEHFDDEYVAHSPFYQEFLLPYGGRYVSGTKLFQDETLSVMFGIHRGIGTPRLQAADVEICKRLAGHLTQAFLLHREHLKLRSEGRLGAELLSKLKAPVALVDEQRRIVRVNAAARAMLDAGETVAEHGGRLHCVRPKDDNEFLIALVKLLRNDVAGPGAMAPDKAFLQARSRSNGPALGLYVCALLPQQTLRVFGDRAMAMVIFHRPEAQLELDPFVVAAAFDLTPAEARVAVAAAKGLSIEDIAAQHAVSNHTVRSQLRSIFQKTGTARQAQLVSKLAGLPLLRWISALAEVAGSRALRWMRRRVCRPESDRPESHGSESYRPESCRPAISIAPPLEELLQQPVISLPIGGVAVAGGVLEAEAVQHGHLTTHIGNQAVALQRTGGHGHAHAPYTEHVGEEFLRDVKLVVVRPVMRHQQPARQARADLVKPQAGRGGRELAHQHVEILVQAASQRAALRQLGTERLAAYAPRRARALGQRTQWRDRDAQCQLSADHAFATDHAHLQTRMSRRDRQQRNETIDREVNVGCLFTRLAQDFREHQLHRFANGSQPRLVLARQRLDEVIFGQWVFSRGSRRPRRRGAERPLLMSYSMSDSVWAANLSVSVWQHTEADDRGVHAAIMAGRSRSYSFFTTA